MATGNLCIAVDIGGTFTDLAAFDESGSALHFGKALSTHDRLVDGIQMFRFETCRTDLIG